MSAGKVKSIEKSQKALEPSSPTHVFARQFTAATSEGAFEVGSLPQVAGNLAVQRLFRTGAIQAKLSLSQPGDADEREADRIAEQVVSAKPVGTIQRKDAACAEGTTCPKCEEEERVQPKEKLGHTPQFNSKIASQITSLLGGGQPLPSSVRTFFEPRFGRDFSQVRVHIGGHSAESAHDIHARAYTTGQDLVFAPGEYAPESAEGQRLLAHELTHVVQQDGEQLQRVQMQAKEGAATGGAPSGREKGPLNFLSTDFPLPEKADRERLWRSMLSGTVPLADDIDYGFLATQFTLSGGEIRNVVLDAAFLAAQSEPRQIAMTNRVLALGRQLTKQGRAPSATEFKQHHSLLAQLIGEEQAT